MGNRRNYGLSNNPALSDTPTPGVPYTQVEPRPVPDSSLAGSYKDFAGDTREEYDEGILILPVASRTPKTVTARVHGGFGVRVERAAAVKKDSPPIMPAARDIRDPITGRVSDTLVSASITIPQPVPNTTGLGYDWTVVTEYTYVTTRPAIDGGPRIPGRSVIPASRLPYPISPQDPAATDLLPSSSGSDMDTMYTAISPTVASVRDGTYVWPFTVLTPAFFDPNAYIG